MFEALGAWDELIDLGGLILWHFSSFLRVHRSWLPTRRGQATYIDTSGRGLELLFFFLFTRGDTLTDGVQDIGVHWLGEDRSIRFYSEKRQLPMAFRSLRGSSFASWS